MRGAGTLVWPSERCRSARCPGRALAWGAAWLGVRSQCKYLIHSGKWRRRRGLRKRKRKEEEEKALEEEMKEEEEEEEALLIFF